MKVLKLGIPKGSLEANTIDLFKKAGWRITSDARSYFPDIDDPEISCKLVRAQEMSRYVEDGTLDLGLTGIDWIMENSSDVVVVQDLIYSKVSTQQARWVLVVREDSPYKSMKDMEGKRISTELVNFTKKYFAEKNINIHVEFSWGATEAKVVEGLVDAVVEVTETGSTIKANKLRIIHELMKTNTQLIANRAAWKNPWKRKKIEQIATMLNGSLQAMGKVGLKLNVSKENLKKVMSLLPSLKSPTISSLSSDKWFAIESIVDAKIMRDLIPKLLEAGAQGLIEYPLNKVI
ncbi:MAG: ATP phosphoribosyltransferase [Deltaproteobacteria bacterium HGW-Deltaproteobacteria-2]|jgi:ATP phosphoribosyltransferase|nr:MAG: ATP phosphoribosyltransferase [Deltaproteobacteria bacterium HGW-Deltaproteobacteria-2]